MMFSFLTSLLYRPEVAEFMRMKSLAELGTTPPPVKPWEEK